MSHDKLATYLEARHRAATYGCESGVDYNAVRGVKRRSIYLPDEDEADPKDQQEQK